MSPVQRYSIAFAACLLVAGAASAAPVASQLSFVPLLPGALTGRPDAPPVTVVIQAANGTLVPDATNSVTISVGQNPSGARLGGTLTVAAQGGLATFTDLALDRDGDGLTLVATSPMLTPAQTAPFSFQTPPDPHDAVGFGCGSAGNGPVSACGALVALFLLRRRRRAAAALLLCLGLLQSASARAQGAPAGKSDLSVAKDLNVKGLAALEAGKYDEAIALFDQARLHVDSPALLYNLAEAHRRAGHTEEALALYHDYVRRVPDPARRADLRKFEALENAPPPPLPGPAAPPPPRVSTTSSRAKKPAGPRGFLNAPGLIASAVWDPIDKRIGAELLASVNVSTWFNGALGLSLAKRPGVRLMLSRALFDDEDFAISVALRGVLAPFPQSPVLGGGGGLTFAAHVTDQLDLTLGTYFEGMHASGVGIGVFLVTLGVSGHL